MLFPPTLGRYELRSRVGEGPLGVVFAAWDPDLEAERRLKVLHPELAQDPDLVARWLQRVRASMNLLHPDLVVPLEVGQDQGFVFAVLPTWPRDLRQDLVLHGPWSPARAVALVRRLAAALNPAHAAGLVHADLKPSNVLLDDHDRVGLTDLGWMQAAAETYGPRLGEVIPRLAADPYVPPEVAQGAGLSPASDVYGLAQLLHELVTGRAFAASAGEDGLADLEALGDLAPALRAGLHPDPEQRPARLEDWLALLPAGDEPAPRPTMASPEPAAAPEFAPLPTPEEAAAQAEARAEAWDQVVVPTAARNDRRQLWVGCTVFALVALFLACGLAGLGALGWRWWSERSSALEPPAPRAPASAQEGVPPAPRELAALRARALQRPPDLQDDFSDPTSGLPDDDRDDLGLLDYADGVYVAEAFPDGIIVGALFDPIYTGPVVLQVRVRLPEFDPEGDGSFGLICAAVDPEHYYTLDISEDGYAGLWRSAAGGTEPVASWEPLPEPVYAALKAGQWVQLTGVCADGHLALWADGVLLVQGVDETATPLTTGQVGLFVNTLLEPGLRVLFDDFALWEMEP